MSVWNLQLARASMLHLDQQVQLFLKRVLWRTKSPANRINVLTRVDIADSNLQVCQELLKDLLLYFTIAWYLY